MPAKVIVRKRKRVARKPRMRNQNACKVVTGRGPYETTAPRSIGGALGRHAGAYLGEIVGHHGERLLRSLTGFGDYEVRVNSLMGRGVSHQSMATLAMGNPPVMINSGSVNTVIRHREYIADVYASNAFNIVAYPIQPALASSLPWASQLSGSFESWRPKGIIFEYKAMSSSSVLSASASTALGTVIMATEYNTDAPAYQSKREMENARYSNSTVPYKSMLHPCECAPKENVLSEYYTRTGDVTTDLRWNDLGTFYIATQGMQNVLSSNVVCGELWCSYEIDLIKEQINNNSNVVADHFNADVSAVLTDAKPFGTGSGVNFAHTGLIQQNAGPNIGCTLTTNRIIFPVTVQSGNFVISYFMSGTVADVINGTPSQTATAIQNCSVSAPFATPFINSTASNQYCPTAGDTLSLLFSFIQYVTITQTTPGLPAILQINLAGPGTLPSASQECDLVIAKVTVPFT